MATPAGGGPAPSEDVDAAGPPPNLPPVKTPPNSGIVPAVSFAKQPQQRQQHHLHLARSSSSALGATTPTAGAAATPTAAAASNRPPPSRATRVAIALRGFPWIPAFGWSLSVLGLLIYVGAAVAAATPGRRLATLLSSRGGGAPGLVAGAAAPVAIVVAAAVGMAVVGAAASAARADAAARADGKHEKGASGSGSDATGNNNGGSWLRRWWLLSWAFRPKSQPQNPPSASAMEAATAATTATATAASPSSPAAAGPNAPSQLLQKSSLQLQHSTSHPRAHPSVFATFGAASGPGGRSSNDNAPSPLTAPAGTLSPHVQPAVAAALPPRRRAYRAQRLSCALMAIACGAFAAASIGLALSYGAAAIIYSDMAAAAHRASDGTAASLAVASDILDGADAIGSMMRDPANIDNPALVALNSTISQLYESVSPGLKSALQSGAAAIAARLEDDGRPPRVDSAAKDEAVMIWSSPTPSSPIVRAVQQATQLVASREPGADAASAAAAAAAAASDALKPQGVRVCQSSLCADMTAVPGARSKTCVCRPATLRTLRRLAEPGSKRSAAAAAGLLLLSLGCVLLVASYSKEATAAAYERDAAHGRATRIDRLCEAKAARRQVRQQQQFLLGKGTSSLSWLPSGVGGAGGGGGLSQQRWSINQNNNAQAAAASAAAAAAAAAAVASPRSLPSSSPRAWGGGKATIPAALVWESSVGGGGASSSSTAAAPPAPPAASSSAVVPLPSASSSLSTASSSTSAAAAAPVATAATTAATLPGATRQQRQQGLLPPPGIPGAQPGSQLRPLGRASWDGVASIKSGGGGSASSSVVPAAPRQQQQQQQHQPFPPPRRRPSSGSTASRLPSRQSSGASSIKERESSGSGGGV